MFGGCTAEHDYECVADLPAGDLWRFDGHPWVEEPVVDGLQGRFGHGMAYDPIRQKLVLFGGHAGFASTCDGVVGKVCDMAWERSGDGSWASFGPGDQSGAYPAGDWGHVMVWDGARQQIVMYACDNGVCTTASLWTWDGQWRKVAVVDDAGDGSPEGRRGANLVWDSARRELALAGGTGPYSCARGVAVTCTDVWTMSAGSGWGDWRLASRGVAPGNATAPVSRTGYNLVRDPELDAVALFGGWGEGSAFNDVHLLRAFEWLDQVAGPWRGVGLRRSGRG